MNRVFTIMAAVIILANMIVAGESPTKPIDKSAGRSVGASLTSDGRIDLEAVRTSGYQGPLDLKGVDVRVDLKSGAPMVSASPMQTPSDDPDDQYWDNSMSPSVQGVNGPVLAMTSYDGKLIVAGYFTVAGGVFANNIACWDGKEWSTLGTGLNGRVSALAMWDGKLIAGGEFQSAGGVPASFVASWDGTHWSPLGSGMNGRVTALTAYDGKLIAGGGFSTTGDDTAIFIASWNDTAWSPLGTGINYGSSWCYNESGVSSFTIYDGKLIVGGCFDVIVEAGTTHNLASWDGNSWSPIGLNTVYGVNALTVYREELIVGGAMELGYCGEYSVVASWNGSSWSSLYCGYGGELQALAVFEDKLFAGLYVYGWWWPGYNTIQTWDGNNWSSVANFGNSNPFILCLAAHNDVLVVGTYAGLLASTDGTVWSPVGRGTNGSVSAIIEYDNQLIVGGSFTIIGDTNATGIASWNGTNWSPLGSGVPGVTALAIYDGKPVAGWFGHVASWDGSNWLPLGGEFHGSVNALCVYDGRLIAGGGFDSAGGVAASSIASWDGSNWSPMASGTSGNVLALAIYDHKLIAAGEFYWAGGVPVSRIASWDGYNWSPLESGMDGTVCALTVYEGKLVAGGNFTTAGGTSASGIASWDGSTWSPLGCRTLGGYGTRVTALGVYDNRLLASLPGYVTYWNGSDWSPIGEMNDGASARAFSAYNNKLVAGGDFVRVGGKVSVSLAQWVKRAPVYTGPVWHVAAADGSEWDHCGSADHPFAVISTAVSMAEPGDTVLVRAGTYGQTCFSGLDFQGKDLVLISASGPDSTIISCGPGQRAFTFNQGETQAALIRGFTIRHLVETDKLGSGILCQSASPTIEGNTFELNGDGQPADNSSAVYLSHSNALIINNRFAGGATDKGGAIRITGSSSPTISSNIFIGNKAYASDRNAEWQDSVYAEGGAIFCGDSASPTIADNLFLGNSAQAERLVWLGSMGARGGAIYCENSSPTLRGNVIAQNQLRCNTQQGVTFGGGVYLKLCRAVLENNTIAYNNAQFCADSAISGYGGGVCIDSSDITISRCLIAFNNGGGLYSPYLPSSSDTISHTDMYGNECYLRDWENFMDIRNANGNMCKDPHFCNADSGDYHLYSTSPCAPANNAGVQVGALGVGCSPTDVAESEKNLPMSFALQQNYPNPFNPTTTIEFNVPTRAHVTLEIFNLLGQHVRTLVDETKSAGNYKAIWDGTDVTGKSVSTGVYLYRFRAGDFVETKKMLLLK